MVVITLTSLVTCYWPRCEIRYLLSHAQPCNRASLIIVQLSTTVSHVLHGEGGLRKSRPCISWLPMASVASVATPWTQVVLYFSRVLPGLSIFSWTLKSFQMEAFENNV